MCSRAGIYSVNQVFDFDIEKTKNTFDEYNVCNVNICHRSPRCDVAQTKQKLIKPASAETISTSPVCLQSINILYEKNGK